MSFDIRDFGNSSACGLPVGPSETHVHPPCLLPPWLLSDVLETASDSPDLNEDVLP